MDEQVRWEAAHVEPSVPFRVASYTHRHATWARTWHSRPELYLQPESLAEIRKVVHVARRCRRHLVVVGSGHSPSDLTCTSGWKLNLDRYSRVLSVDKDSGVVVLEAGIRLYQIQETLKEHGLGLPNAGSINDQSIAGAIATGTHGSSLRHGLLSDNVLALKLLLADGSLRSCSRTENVELFCAALVSLGALGVVVELTFQAISDFKVEWRQTLEPLDWVLDRWDKDLWTSNEFVRVWWMPYMRKCIYWRADKTDLPLSEPSASGNGGLLGGRLGFHVYQTLLYICNWIPSLTPWVERVVGRVQYGSSSSSVEGETAVQWARDGLKMDCLYSQFVNEWAIPLAKGPEAISRLSAWLHGDSATARLPFSSRGIYVHAPIEVRVSHGRMGTGPRAFLDPTEELDGPTLYLNATLYRPYHSDPPCTRVYYAAFEHLMRELGGRPHWAKNFSSVNIAALYPDTAHRWLAVRDEVDPLGMFSGEWHRRTLYGVGDAEESATRAASAAATGERGSNEKTRPIMPLEERKWVDVANRAHGGRNFYGQVAVSRGETSPPISEGSFEMMDHGDAEMSFMLDSKFIGDE